VPLTLGKRDAKRQNVPAMLSKRECDCYTTNKAMSATLGQSLTKLESKVQAIHETNPKLKQFSRFCFV
jgi:hypothetical protein